MSENKGTKQNEMATGGATVIYHSFFGFIIIIKSVKLKS